MISGRWLVWRTGSRDRRLDRDFKRLSRVADGVVAGLWHTCFAHIYVYTNLVKRRELERRLRAAGWKRLRHGGNHDIWGSESGEDREPVPRHDEISEQLATKILRNAERRQS
jgi:predicted RNA binding protein YcfA (HicA-like mRNA interferase family)